MVRKRLIILIGIIIVCTGGVFAKRSLIEKSDDETHAQWEYGVYRVGVSSYRYEWQGADKRAYGKSKIDFLNKMGRVSIINELQTMTDARPMTLEYAFDTLFLNYLGTQGWELVDTLDRGSGAIANRTFWLKRHKR
jgi:hypothetical protein